MLESQPLAKPLSPVRSGRATRPATICNKSTNDPRFVHGADGRSRLMRRRRDLIAIFVADLGGDAAVTPSLMVSVTRAADAVAIAESHRSRALRGEAINLDDLVRVENIASRAVKALGIKPGAGGAKPPSLSDYLASRKPSPPAEEAAE